jgi:hypothetical protein
MLDKFKIKQFVHDAVHMHYGLAAKLAKDYSKTDFWISDLLSSSSETDGFPYAYTVFMERIAEKSPEACAMIDDEVRRIMDEIRMPSAKGGTNESVDVLLEGVGKAYTQLLTAYRTRQGRGELKAVAAKLDAQVGNLLQALDPPKPMLIGDDKRRTG